MITKAYLPLPKYSQDYDLRRLVQGIKKTDLDLIEIKDLTDIPVKARDYLLIGDVSVIRAWRLHTGIKSSFVGDYPIELARFYGRKIESVTIKDILRCPTKKVFIKPLYKGTFVPFVGSIPLLSFPDSMLNVLHIDESTSVWIQAPVVFIAEWRVFICNREVLDVRQYYGSWKTKYDNSMIEAISCIWLGPHSSYCIDIGMTDKNLLVVIEVNDSCAFGSYGIDPLPYAKMHIAHWENVWRLN